MVRSSPVSFFGLGPFPRGCRRRGKAIVVYYLIGSLCRRLSMVRPTAWRSPEGLQVRDCAGRCFERSCGWELSAASHRQNHLTGLATTGRF